MLIWLPVATLLFLILVINSPNQLEESAVAAASRTRSTALGPRPDGP